MKHKITNVTEPIDDIELQMVKDAKEFSNTIVKLVASTTVGMFGTTLQVIGNNTDFSAITTVLGMFMLGVCGGLINPKLINRLSELYNKKGNVPIQENELSGGIKR